MLTMAVSLAPQRTTENIMNAPLHIHTATSLSIQVGTLERNETKANPSTTQNGDTSTFQQVEFPTPFPPDSNVVVVPMVQTFNGSATPGVRIADVRRTGFTIRMNELVTKEDSGKRALSIGGHAIETIGWVAFATL